MGERKMVRRGSDEEGGGWGGGGGRERKEGIAQLWYLSIRFAGAEVVLLGIK